ncbi:predicted protein [Thalassiosira pseudonana CCMP1335]|uniref:FAD-binding FR-type domain-containing protein n=1 Tax=Thalassiosira pseudonana TaxID=35128 RepID=B8CG47_THAPS|nr:predicted protein [Thalassiosira pseudonana CCMP1335]EED87425.1 predicted protein [Thalassiosira pseudonana CCMP1335]|eukprot:g3893.t1 g3893   contig13:408222-410531(+)
MTSRKPQPSPPSPSSYKHIASSWTPTIRYKALKLSQVICAVYILIMTFRYYPRGLIDPSAPLGEWRIVDVWNPSNTEAGVIQLNGDPYGQKRAVVAKDRASLIFLAISRISAFTLYPPMFLIFMTKCKATINFLMRTPLSLFMVDDQHELHSFCGKYIAFDVWVHTLFHCLRWGIQGNIDLLWTNITGLSGLIVVLATPLITFPMFINPLRLAMSYEVRKGLHYLFYLFAIGMCFHNKTSAFPNGGFNQVVLGFCIVYYTLDSLYVMIFMTEMIETTVFNVLPSGVQMTMAVSDHFQKTYAQGGYGYVCLPWVSKYQWHAFSLFEHPTDPNLRQVFMMKVQGGDWTNSVHEQLQRNTVRPVWISGPFVSPYNNALDFDNTICVASGIGITPALSVIRAHRESRRINLIWTCRDVAMLEFFSDHLYLNNDDGWILIFYTGKEPLSPAIENANSNVILIKRRPDLHRIVPNIIYGIESGKGVPEIRQPSEKVKAKEFLADKLEDLEEMLLSEDEIVEELTMLAHEKGFLLSNLVAEDDTDEGKGLLEVVKEHFSSTPPVKHIQQDTSHNNTGPYQRRKSQRVRQVSNIRRNSMMDTGYCPSEEHEGADEFVRNLNKRLVLSTWGLLYCGGSKPVENTLRQISKEYNIALHPESFAW